MKRWLIALALCALLPGPAAAQLEGALSAPAETPSPSAAAEQTISETQAEGADARIAQRIRAIFAELPAFSGVEVSVSQGVVSLSGTVPETADAARAEAIAGRVSGVVTVDSALERDISVSASAGSLASLRAQFNDLLRLLPLIAVAIAVAAVIALIGYALAGLTGLWHRIAPNSFLAELIASAIRFVFILAGLVVGLNMVGAGTLLGAVLGGAGVIGIALGFAMRDTIENYVASLMLSLRQPFRANDLVCIDTYEGRIIRLTSRATVLMTLDGNHLRIPNSQVFKAVILNFTRNPQRRFEFDLGVDADDDALAARRLGRETLAGLDFVLAEPAPDARVIEVGDSNVVIRFLGWIDQRESDWWKTQSLAIVAVKTALEQAGFGLPEPIYRLRFDPRSATLPFENKGEGGGGAGLQREEASVARPMSGIEHEDVRPAEEIASMVDAERATAQTGERDLLDHERPIE